MSSNEDKIRITLGLLNAINDNSSVTQRSIASNLGIALGLTNSYLKHGIKKGFIKVTQAPANRYAYYLTPRGFAEKSKLTARYLTISFDFYRHARSHCNEVLDTCSVSRLTRIAFVGVSDLTEIAIICASNYDIEIVGFFDRTFNNSCFANKPVYRSPDELIDVDALIITDLLSPQETFNEMCSLIPDKKIFSPRLLNISSPGYKGIQP